MSMPRLGCEVFRYPLGSCGLREPQVREMGILGRRPSGSSLTEYVYCYDYVVTMLLGAGAVDQVQEAIGAMDADSP